MWIDTHCHLDAPEFDVDREQVILRARQAGVGLIVVPAVSVGTFESSRRAAQACQGAYALGIHPLFVREDPAAVALDALSAALSAHRDDERLVAVGEIGLDGFVPELQDPDSQALQAQLYAAQLALAAAHGLPVIVHVRRSADLLLKHLRGMKVSGRPVPGGIAHAFNGSAQQAKAFLDLGFKLGFGGAMTFERALQIRRLASSLPEDAIVLETDAPDIPPSWLYRPEAARRTLGRARNEPAMLPRIAETLATLRHCEREAVQAMSTRNALAALPRLQALWRP
jgi:TatD DNase family protein